MIWVAVAAGMLAAGAVAEWLWLRGPRQVGAVSTAAGAAPASAWPDGASAVGPPAGAGSRGAARILFPFIARTLSSPALAATLRLAWAEGATLVPVFLARVSLDLPLDAVIPQQAGRAIPLLEAVEREAARAGVAVDARIERGRSYRHAPERAIAHERFDRIVVAAAADDGAGFRADDAAWLLDHAPGEIIVIRPAAGRAPQSMPPAAEMRHGPAASVDGAGPEQVGSVRRVPSAVGS